MSQKINLKGQAFGRFTVLEEAGRDKHGQVLWKCKCECGEIRSVLSGNLRRGLTLSCGCLGVEKAKKSNTIHGLRYLRMYDSWRCMIRRCNNPKDQAFGYYGGRGIKVCGEWLDVKVFYKDMGERPKGLTLERIDNEKGYYKENCKWASRIEQQRNHGIHKNNTSGVQGVSWRNRDHSYSVYIMANYKQIHLGCFKKIEDAIDARRQGEMEYWR